MTTLGNLDDLDQISVYIPYQGSDNTEEQASKYSPFPATDLPNGYERRLKIYRQAWAKCLARIHEIIRTLHSPLAFEIVRHVKEAYTDILPGLPHTELPVISVSGHGGGASILHSVATQLETLSDEDEGDNSAHCALLVHLYSNDCPNIMTAMKSMITGFIDASSEGRTKRKPTASLANYDIELLKAWYTFFGIQNDSPQLVVMLHEFEQFEPNVIQDLFYICSLHIPQLPLVFILSLSSPPEPSYLHMAYSRSTLSLLRVRTVSVPSGVGVLEQILHRTFFDVGFDPDIIVGPIVLDFLHDYFTRHNCSLDSVITIIQLTHMKHIDEPLTIFLYDEQLGLNGPDSTLRTLKQPLSFPFLEYLFTRVITSPTHWESNDLSELLVTISEYRKEFRFCYRRFKVGLGLVIRMRTAMLEFGHRSVEGEGLMDIMNKGLRGRLTKDWKYLGMMVKKLSAENLVRLIEQLEWYFEDMPEGVFEQEEEARLTVASLRDEVSKISEGDDPATREVATRLGEWFVEYSAERLSRRLDECRLWDIWYTGSTPFPSELINPAPKAHMIAALLHPEDYLPWDFRSGSQMRPGGNSNEGEPLDVHRQQPELHELSDTSILFQRYLEGGKMINVYDWFESFAVVLENQRRELEEDGETPETPTRKAKEARHDKAGDEETWGMEVQARFIRAVHELDFMGLIKHTGRKADHVLKTVFYTRD